MVSLPVLLKVFIDNFLNVNNLTYRWWVLFLLSSCECLFSNLKFSSEGLHQQYNEKIRRFSRTLIKKWNDSSRTKERFLQDNKQWLDTKFLTNDEECNNLVPARGPSLQDFETLSDRQKRRRTHYLSEYPEEHISFVAKNI